MTQLISNVLMQPKPDAVERPMTLIEKLEQERKTHRDLVLQSTTLQDSAYYNGVTVGFMGAIGVVNQHQAESGWVRCAEILPKNPMFYLVDEEGEYFKARYFRGRWETSSKLRVYPEFWFDGKIGNPRKNIPVVLSKQPPSEVQDD